MSTEESYIVSMLKQYADYDIAAETQRKIKRKHCKKWFDLCLHQTAAEVDPGDPGGPGPPDHQK